MTANCASERNSHGPPAQARPRTQGEGRGLPPIGRCHGGGADQRDQPDSPNPTIRTLNGARSPLRRHPRRRSTRQSRSLDSPGVGESALVEFASSLVLTSAHRPAAHQPTRGALEQLAGQHGLGLRPENCAQLGPADRPRTRLPAYPRRARRASALRAPTDQPRSRSKDQVQEA